MDMNDDDDSSNSSQPSCLAPQAQVMQRVTMVSAPNTVPVPTTTLMLVTSNTAGAGLVAQPAVAVRQAALGQPGAPTAIAVRPTANGIAAAGGLVVLSGTSMAGASPAHSMNVPTQGGLATTLAVRTATTANPSANKTHTILVMPVSSTGPADMPTVKRIKTE